MSMDLTNGELSPIGEKLMKAIMEGKLPDKTVVDLADATPKQQEDMQVSLHDHSSTLGKKLSNERRKRDMTKNGLRKLRRKGVLK